jgi:hypothetical protein
MKRKVRELVTRGVACVLSLAAHSAVAASEYSVPAALLKDDRADDEAFDRCLRSAIAASGSCVLPEGTLILSMYPRALRQEIPRGILNLRRATLRGQGERSIIKGVSPKGFDVLQLNGVANFSIQNLTITAEASEGIGDSGINGISMTNGTHAITIRNVHVHDLLYVRKPDYIDGGKAFTIQTGEYNEKVAMRDISVEHSSSRNVLAGFWMDADTNKNSEPYNINVVDNTLEGDLAGVVFSFVKPGRPMHAFKATVLNNTIRGGQYGILLGRGRKFRVEDNDVAVQDELRRRLAATPPAENCEALHTFEVASIALERNTFEACRSNY